MLSFFRFVCVLLLSMLVFSSARVGVVLATDEKDIAFKWAFGVVKADDPSKKMVPITGDTTLNSGDQLKMMVEVEQPTFVYLIHHNAEDGIKLLFPYSLQQFEADYERGRKYFIPQGDSRFRLDGDPGRETFHLLASAQRLETLEGLLASYEAADASKRPELAQQVLNEIRTLRKQNRELAMNAERPVAIGGAIRGIETQPGGGSQDIAGLAESIQASGFIARAFSIEHR